MVALALERHTELRLFERLFETIRAILFLYIFGMQVPWSAPSLIQPQSICQGGVAN
jgi:hypothetical protein